MKKRLKFGGSYNWLFTDGATEYAEEFLAILRPMRDCCWSIKEVLTMLITTEHGKGVALEVNLSCHHLAETIDGVSLIVCDSVLLFTHRIIYWL